MTTADLTVELLLNSNVNAKRFDRLQIKKDEIHYNLLRMPKDALPAIFSETKILSSTKPTAKGFCSAGKYTLSVTKNNKMKTEFGCLESLRAKKLIQAFDKIEKVAQRARLD